MVEAGYACVGGNATSRDVCTVVACGDGKRQGAEECDDGNARLGDGCNSFCAIEPRFKCVGGTSEGPDACAIRELPRRLPFRCIFPLPHLFNPVLPPRAVRVFSCRPAFVDASANIPRGGTWLALGDFEDDLLLEVVIDGSLYRQSTQGGVFVLDITISGGCCGSAGAGGQGRVGALGDFDNDGLLDVYINMAGLFRNTGRDGAGKSIFVAVPANVSDGLTQRSAGQAASWGDCNGDGYIDLFLARNDHTSGGSRLFVNKGGGLFVDSAASFGGDATTGRSLIESDRSF